MKYDGNSKPDLHGYSESDYAGDPPDRKASNGQICFLAGAAVNILRILSIRHTTARWRDVVITVRRDPPPLLWL